VGLCPDETLNSLACMCPDSLLRLWRYINHLLIDETTNSLACMCPDSLLRLWGYINHLLTYLLSHEDAQDKNDWRVRIKGATSNPDLCRKWPLKMVYVCVCVYGCLS